MILPATQSILNTNFRGRDRAIAFGIWGARHRRRRGPGSADRRLADDQPVVALVVLHQHPGGHHRHPGNAAIHRGVARRGRAGRLRRARLRADHVRPERLHLRPHRGQHVRLVDPQAALRAAWAGRGRSRTSRSSPSPSRSASWRSACSPGSSSGASAPASSSCSTSSCGGSRPSATATWPGTIVSLGEFGLLFVLPLFLQAALGLSAFETGLIFLSLARGGVLRGADRGDAGTPLRAAPDGQPGNGARGRGHPGHDAAVELHDDRPTTW